MWYFWRIMLPFLSIVFATITMSLGAKWNDFRGGDVRMPIKLDIAEASGWVVSETDDFLNIKWYSRNKEDMLSIAFDKLGNCAGVRIVVYENDVDPEYLPLYRESTGIFEVIDYNGQRAYKSVVLFTPEGFLQKGGRQLKWMSEDEVAYFAYLRQDGKYKMLARETCIQAYGGYVEQGCQSNYGLVLSHFDKESDCDYIKPFYTIYNLEDDGDLIGFGWLLFNKEPGKDTFLKHITSDSAKKMFPQSPTCLTSYPNLAVGEVWLSYAEGQKTSCESKSWVHKHCKKARPSDGSSSSDSSEDSDSDEESFWSKWFG